MPKKTLFIILVGTLLTSFTMLRSGLQEYFGMGFWGPNGHDAIWHLSVANHFFDAYPTPNPVLAGESLKNYHIGYDIILATISKLTSISTLHLYFRIFPLIISFLLGYLVYKYTKSNIPVILIYFAGSFGWIYTLAIDKTIAGESLFWAMQAASTQLNPPFALSLVLLLLGLISLKKAPVLAGVFFAISTAIKVYSGVLVGLALIGLIFSKRKKQYFVTLLVHTAISLIILAYYGTFTLGQQILLFQPFWFTHSLINATDKLYFPKLATLQFNLSSNPFTYKLPVLFLIELGLVFVFYVGNFGGRVFAFKEILKATDDQSLFLKFLILAGMVIPIFFVQNGTAWNTIQFMYYSMFFSALFIKSSFFANRKVLVGFLLISCIGSYGTLKDYFGFPPPSYIDNQEMAALSFLSRQEPGTVLTYPYDKYQRDKYKKTPLPLYSYESTAYVSAFSGKQTFLEDEVNLSITLSNYKGRLAALKTFFMQSDSNINRGFLLNNDISYIYLYNGQKLSTSPSELQINSIYDNGLITVYKVRK